MSKDKDENDRLCDGTLPKDPSEGTERMTPPGYKKPERGPIRLDERRSPSAKFNIQAEKALLGALLWAGANQPDALRIRQVLDILETGEAFHGQGYGDVFDAMKECAQHGEHDPVAVNTELARRGGGIGFDDLVALKLEASTVSESHARQFAKTIRVCWVRRCLARDARLLAEAADDPRTDDEILIEQFRSAMSEARQRLATDSHSVSMSQSASSFFAQLTDKTREAIPTGFHDLDEAISGGLRPGEVSILGARTSVGKSALAACISEHIVTANAHLGVLYVTLEMAHESFAARLVSARSGVPLSNLRRKVLNPIQWSQVTQAVADLKSKPLYFTDSPSQTMAAIYAAATERARSLEREGKRLALVVIDHLGLVKPSAEALKRASREQQVAETSRGQRYIAAELGVHVLGIAQISRESERQPSNMMPKLSHLRESGSLEMDADIVMILHRERDPKTGLFDRQKPPALAIAKGRMDETAIMLLGYEPSRARFTDWNGDEKFGDVYR